MMDLSNLVFDTYYLTNDPDLQVKLSEVDKLKLRILNRTFEKKSIMVNGGEKSIASRRFFECPIDRESLSIDIQTSINNRQCPLQVVHEAEEIKKLQDEIDSLRGKVEQSTLPTTQPKDEIKRVLEQVNEFKKNFEQLPTLIEKTESQLKIYEKNKEDLQAVKDGLSKITQLQNEGALSKITEIIPQINQVKSDLSEVKDLLSDAKTLFDQMNHYKSQIEEAAKISLERSEESEKNLRAVKDGLDKIIRLQKKDVLSKLYNATPQIASLTSQISKVKNLLSTAETLSDQMDEKRNQIEEAAKIILDKSAEIKQKHGESEKLLESFQEKKDTVNNTAKEVQETKDTISSNVETIQQTLETIKQKESKFRKNRAKAWEQWIQQENETYFLGAAEQLRKQYLQKLQEQVGGGVSPEKKQNLQRAQKLLDDFCDRMKRVGKEKKIPLSIQNALTRIRSLRSQFEISLPPFQPPALLSIQEHEAKQKERIASAILNDAEPQRQSYEAYIETEYTQALKKYAHQLKEEIKHPPTTLTDEELERQFRDFASMTLNAFYPNTQAEPEMQTIAIYFDKKTLPSLLDAFGFEEIPITIGKTQVMESLHEITESRPSKYPSETVIEVLSKGFRKKGEPSGVVRKARVIRAE